VFHPGDSADGSYPLTTPIQPVASLGLGWGLGRIPPALVHPLHAEALRLRPDFYASDHRFALLWPHISRDDFAFSAKASVISEKTLDQARAPESHSPTR
jgi:hypothetical protein